MARKSIINGGASQVYEACQGDNCTAPARKATIITSMDETGFQHHVVPLCKNCADTVHKNAKTRGLPTPKTVRLTKDVAQKRRAADPSAKFVKHSDNNSLVFRKTEGDKKPINPRKNTASWDSPDRIVEFFNARIKAADPFKTAGVPGNSEAVTDTSTAIGRAYNERAKHTLKEKRTPKEREAILKNQLKKVRKKKGALSDD